MKKIMALFCSMALCLVLCSCVKSEEAENVDNLILEIGTVTLNSEEKIQKAEKAVEALEESDYKQLDNLSVLEEAKKSYLDLQVAELEIMIDKIASGTPENEVEITTARFNYDRADEEVKEKVGNYSKLEKAEKELMSIKIENVTKLIDGIGTVDISKDSVVKEALNAYNSLSKKERDEIKNYDILSDAMKKIKVMKEQAAEKQKQEAEQRAKQALSKMKVSTDKVEGVTWYFPSVFPKYADIRSYVLPYIGKQGTNVWLRLKLNYTADDWIFFDQVIFAIDGKNYYKTYGYLDVERDNDTEVWEYVDFMPGAEDIDILRKIADSKETIVRFQGDQYYYDLTIKNSDKSAIKDVLIAYDALKNQ